VFRLRPVLVGRNHLYLRYGLLFHLHVPKESIARVRRAQPGDTPVPRKSEPTMCLELAQAMDAEGIFGIRRRITKIGLTPDDERGFERALTEWLQIGRCNIFCVSCFGLDRLAKAALGAKGARRATEALKVSGG
jgi:hypothetical protein